MKKEKVFVVSCQTLSSLGFSDQDLKNSLNTNSDFVEPIYQFPSEGLMQTNACEVKGDLLKLIYDENENWLDIAKNDRKFELWAALIQKNKSHLSNLLTYCKKEETKIVMGLGANAFPLQNIALQIKELNETGIHKTIEKLNFSNGHKGNAVFNHLDIYAHYFQHIIGKVSETKSILTACSSSTQALAIGAGQIMTGKAEMVIVGGTDSIINQFAYIAFGKLGVLTDGICRPFDNNRSGAIAGECAGFAVLVSEKLLSKLNQKPEFELIGFGSSLDAYKITAPDPAGKGVEKAISRAIDLAGINPSEIDYINAHGTGTRSNDEVEIRAIERVLGSHASKTVLSSTKDRHGHCIAAAGILEFHVLINAMKNDKIPVNKNLLKPIDTKLILPKIGDRNDYQIRIGMTNNFAFGGVNCSLIVKNHSI